MPKGGRGWRDEPGGSGIRHERVVRRLIDYQRRLREGKTRSEAIAQVRPETPLIDYASLDEEQRPVATETPDVVDLTRAEREVAGRAESALVVVPDAQEAAPEAFATSELVAEALREALEATKARVQTLPSDPAARAEALGKTLRALAKDLEQLRVRTRDTALAIDSRLAAMQERVAKALGENLSS